ncbi:SIMPL domain-containing protein [Neobacillus kokaensis]|uniref:DUF541 domain-containing protein n=1 Tax=Neobacillus kokaensis TaxID=2759023 RepID=A0ABQ3N8E7_9BACI|nr:SIMPL domain-containing protein [Neobacillus kokaensis]GHI01013.1 hypothetical protein AM1BK_45550 [Neobacillus kokaensis]
MYNYQLQGQNGLPSLKWNVMKVNGEGVVDVRPDSASVNLGVITESKELIAAQKENSVKSTNVINSLVSQGIGHERIKTFDYRIDSDYDYIEGKQIFRGYKVTNILKVKIDDLAGVGKVVDEAVKSGINYVSNVQFSVENKEHFYKQALTLALTDSIEKAKTLAAALKVHLNPTPRLIIESGTTVHPLSNYPETLVKGISSTPFEPGQIQVKASILAEFQYTPRVV